MQKVAIIGSGGSGKSTLAIQLGSALQLPVYHLDAFYWQPNWVESDREQWVEIQRGLVSQSHWIVDGNYGGTLDIRLEASDTIIFLDVNRYICLFRAIKRTLKHLGKNRTDMGSGCNERFDFDFIKWIHGYPKKKRPEILAKLSALEKVADVHILSNKKELANFLECL